MLSTKQQNKPIGDTSKRWVDKKGNKFIPSHEGNKSTNSKGAFKGQFNRNGNKPRFKVPCEARKNEPTNRNETKIINRPPV